jgi:uncharacterized protein DUF4440
MLAAVWRVKDSSRTESLRLLPRAWHGDDVDQDGTPLHALDERFIAACRAGSWERLRVILDEDFRYLEGRARQTWDEARDVADLQANPSLSSLSLRSGEPVIHVAGETAAVRARTRRDDRPGRGSRCLDTYGRRDGRWLCVHAFAWLLTADDAAGLAS